MSDDNLNTSLDLGKITLKLSFALFALGLVFSLGQTYVLGFEYFNSFTYTDFIINTVAIIPYVAGLFLLAGMLDVAFFKPMSEFVILKNFLLDKKIAKKGKIFPALNAFSFIVMFVSITMALVSSIFFQAVVTKFFIVLIVISFLVAIVTTWSRRVIVTSDARPEHPYFRLINFITDETSAKLLCFMLIFSFGAFGIAFKDVEKPSATLILKQPTTEPIDVYVLASSSKIIAVHYEGQIQLISRAEVQRIIYLDKPLNKWTEKP